MTSTQRKQVAYLERMNEREIRFGGWRTSYSCSCRTCGEGKHFGAAESARRWVERHEGHRTWIDTLR